MTFPSSPPQLKFNPKSVQAWLLAIVGDLKSMIGLHQAPTSAHGSSFKKISTLILNINLYMIDVPERKILLALSVDIRGNPDLSWTRGMTSLVKNHDIHRGTGSKN